MNALTQTEQAEEYIDRFALRELVEEWLSRVSVECPEDPYQYLIDEAVDQRRSGGGIVTCPNSWCNMTMPASRFPAHQQMCNNAANWVRCVRCNLRVEAAKLSQHRLYCKLERCVLCGEMVLPRMLPMCPYRKVAKAERDRQAAMHRKERRLEKEAISAVPLITREAANPPQSRQSDVSLSKVTSLPASPLPPPASSPSSCAGKLVVTVRSQTPVASLETADPNVAADSGSLNTCALGATVKPIMKASSRASVTQRHKSQPGCGTASPCTKQEGKSTGDAASEVARGTTSGVPSEGGESSSSSSVPRPSFPALLAADMALREKLENYPAALVPVLSTIQAFWRRNMTLHLFREQVFSAVWRHMDSAQEGAAGQSKEGAAIRLVERNLRSERRLSSIDNDLGGNAGSRRRSSTRVPAAASAAAAAAAAAAAVDGSKELSSSSTSDVLKDNDVCADEDPIASFQSDPVYVADNALGNGGFMRVRDLEALTRHCQAREVLQFSVVLKVVRAATKVLRQRPLVQRITIPANSSLVVVGDLHGQMKDLEYIINYMGLPSAERYYLFNGDFIDRGPYGCEVLMFIYGLLCTYPEHVFLNRGNHENYSTNTEYGFMAELYAKYAGRASYLLDAMTDSYEVMPLMSVIDNRVAVMHGGAPRLLCKLDEIEAIGHVRDIPVEQQSTRAEQLLAELLWNDPVEKFRSRQLGMNHQGEGWRTSSRGCGVEYLSNITEQFLKNNDLKLLIRSHDVKSAGFELIHKNKSITVFSASNYGGVSGNRGAVAVLTREAEQPVFHTWFLKEDHREYQQEGLLDGGIDAFLQDGRSRRHGVATSSSSSPKKLGGVPVTGSNATGAETVLAPGMMAKGSVSSATRLGDTSGALVVVGGGGASPPNLQNSASFGASVQPQPPKRLNAAMLAEASLMDGDEYICAFYLTSGAVLDDEDLMSDTSSRSVAVSDSEDRISTDHAGGANSAVAVAATSASASATALAPASVAAGDANCASLARSSTSLSTKANSTSRTSSLTQRWPTGSAVVAGAGGGSVNNARLAATGSRGTQASLASHLSLSSQGSLRVGCSLAQDMSILVQLQTLQQIRELIYFQRYALLVAFNQVDEMHTGTVYKAEWCVVMRDVLKLDIPWYYLCQFLAPRLVVDGVPSVEYMRFLRHFDVSFAIDFRLSWQTSTIQRISSGLDLPDDIINAFCERPTVNASNTSNRNAATASLCGDADSSSPSLHGKTTPELLLTSPPTMTPMELPTAMNEARLATMDSAPSVLANPAKPLNLAASKGQGDGEMSATVVSATDLTTSEKLLTEDEDWWHDVQLDFKTFAMKVRVLSPAAAAMEDNEIFALFCFFDVSMQGHVYVGDMVDSITAVVDEEGSVNEAELLVSGEIDFSTVTGRGPPDGRDDTCQPCSPSCSISISSSSSKTGETPCGVSNLANAKNDAASPSGRNLLASKLKMAKGKSRLMRPPSSPSSSCSSSDEERHEAPHSVSHTAPSSLLGGGRSVLHRSSSSSSKETDASSSVTSTRPTASGRNSDALEAPLPLLQKNRDGSGARTPTKQGNSFDSGLAPPILASTGRLENFKLVTPPSQVLALPLEYDDDETPPNDIEATTACDAEALSASKDMKRTENTAAATAAAPAAFAHGEKGRASRSLACNVLARKDSAVADIGGKNSGAAAPTSLVRVHSFNEYAVSMASACSVSTPAIGASKPFDDFTSGIFQFKPDNESSARGTGSGSSGIGTGPTPLLSVEQRVNKRLAMPPWIYPTLLRVQEQLLGGYVRLRFLFQALNRSRTGHLTEAEFLPLMEFMNCVFEHSLSAEQAHMLFVYVHDSAINYMQSMRNRRRQRSSSLYSEGFDAAAMRRSPVGTVAERVRSTGEADAASAAPVDNCTYTRHRMQEEQARGERYILLIEFLAFFGVKPVQYEDDLEALEELLYEVTGTSVAAATTTVSTFPDVARESSADGVEGGRPFASTGMELDDKAGSLSIVSNTVSAAGGAVTCVDSAERHTPAQMRVNGPLIETPTSFRMTDMADIAARASTAAPLALSRAELDPSASQPHQPGRLSGDAATTSSNALPNAAGHPVKNTSFCGHRPRLSSSSAIPADEGAAAAGGSRTGPRRLVSSMAVGWNGGPHTSGSGTPMAQTPLRSRSTAVPSGALLLADDTDHQLRASMLPTPTDVFTALASLRDAYGEDITLKELMQRLAARQPRRCSRLLLQPLAQNNPPHAPTAIGASSLASYASNLSEANRDGASASAQQLRQKRSLHCTRADLQTVLVPLAPEQRSSSQGTGQPRRQRNSPAAAQVLTMLNSSTSSSPSPTPTTASLDVPSANIGLQRSPSNGHFPTWLDGRNSPGADAEFSFASLQATLSHHGKGSTRNMTVTSLPPVLVPPPPPVYGIPTGRTTGGGNHQRSNSFLESSMASISARPYVLNQAQEQRTTVLASGPYVSQYATLAPSLATNLPVLPSNLTSGSVSGMHSSGQNGTGSKRGSSESRSIVLDPAGVPRESGSFRQRLIGHRATKYETAALVGAMNTSRESELTSTPLVLSMVPPPAPPTRQRVNGRNGSPTTSEASRTSSTASDNRSIGSSATTAPRTSRQPPPPPPPPPPPSVDKGGSGGVVVPTTSNKTSNNDNGGSNSNTDNTTTGTSENECALANVIASTKREEEPSPSSSSQQQQQNSLSPPACPSSPTRLSADQPSSQTQLPDDRVKTTKAQKPDAELKASAEKKKATEAKQAPSVVSPKTKAATATATATTEPSRTRTKLDSDVATAKTTQGKSQGSSSSSSGMSPDVSTDPSSTGPSAHNGKSSNRHNNNNNNQPRKGNANGVNGGGGKPSIPAPPRLQLDQNDLNDHATASHGRESRPTPLISSTKPSLQVGKNEVVSVDLRSSASDVAKAQNSCAPDTLEVAAVKGGSSIAHSDLRSGETAARVSIATTTTNCSSTATDLGAPCSISSTMAPATPSPTLSDGSGTAHSSTDSVVDSITLPPNSGSPPTRERHIMGRTRGARRGLGSGNKELPSTTSTTDSHRSRSDRHDSSSNNSCNLTGMESSSPENRSKAKSDGTTSTTPVSPLSPLHDGTVRPDEVPLSNKSNVSNKSPHHAVRGARAKKERTLTDVAVPEPPVSSTPVTDRNASSVAAHECGKPVPQPGRRRQPLKSSVMTTDVMQRMYGTAPAKRGPRKAHRSLSGGTPKPSNHGSVTALASRKASTTATTSGNASADAAQLVSLASDSPIAASAWQQQQQQRRRPGANHDGSATFTATHVSGGLTPRPPSQASSPAKEMSELSTAATVLPEAPEKGGEVSPTAESAAVSRSARSSLGRKNDELGGGGGDHSSPEGADALRATSPTGIPAPLSLAKVHPVPVLPSAMHLVTSTSGGHPSSTDRLPAIDKGISSGSSSGVSSPNLVHRAHDLGPHHTGPKSSPLLPLPSPIPMTSTALSSSHVNSSSRNNNDNIVSLPKDANSAVVAATSSPVHSRTAAEPMNSGSEVGTASRRTAAQGVANIQVSEEDPCVASVGPHSALSPSRHKGPRLSPLAPKTKRPAF